MKLSRRNFISKSGLLAGSLGLGAFPSWSIPSESDKKVRIGIVGGGSGLLFNSTNIRIVSQKESVI